MCEQLEQTLLFSLEIHIFIFLNKYPMCITLLYTECGSWFPLTPGSKLEKASLESEICFQTSSFQTITTLFNIVTMFTLAVGEAFLLSFL